MPLPRTSNRQPPPRRWIRGLYGCCDDPILACSTCICECNATGQLYQRLTKEPRCKLIAITLWILFFVGGVLSTIAQVHTQTAVRTTAWGFTYVDWHQFSTGTVLSSIAGTVGFVGTVVTTWALCTSRRRLRARDEIPIECCEVEDCCVSYFCSWCVINQMFAQEKIKGTNYSALTRTGNAV